MTKEGPLKTRDDNNRAALRRWRRSTGQLRRDLGRLIRRRVRAHVDQRLEQLRFEIHRQIAGRA